MIGRNDPCLCGSGKKYKKCCEGKQQVTTEQVFLDEIEHVLQTFYNVYPEKKDIKDYIDIVNEWSPKLDSHLQRELIEAVALDDFFFHKRADIWANYLKRTMKKMIRPKMVELLNGWNQPSLFIGEVVAIEENYFKAVHALTKEELFIRRESNRVIPEGMQVFSFLLPDGSKADNQFLAVSTLIFFPTNYKQAFDNFASQFDRSNNSVEQFLKDNHLNFWIGLVDSGYSGEEYTSFEIEVVDQAKQFLEEKNIEAPQLLVSLEDYLVEKKPKARKPAAIAAGAIRFAQERNLLNGTTFTVKEIAENFGVSSSSLNKYYQELLDYDAVLA
ncbi:SEC-C metal-binding domain-containing protein [Ureibacillus aquaedulcis]|uniref:SEC-C metal-binding domain-containing protein n=1 Tax=Ureibacillus aquaedulcis TaxID=3058421 RepID=A0ABT8GQV0_9BACL|nr:SEC-C metal-binding domain-containing protein [Ureibacillus sp. BA0131]MDN4493791.1 SEC-C metal-binding domain-containing protein [Ureibacillus sp. BA0131]